MASVDAQNPAWFGEWTKNLISALTDIAKNTDINDPITEFELCRQELRKILQKSDSRDKELIEAEFINRCDTIYFSLQKYYARIVKNNFIVDPVSFKVTSSDGKDTATSIPYFFALRDLIQLQLARELQDPKPQSAQTPVSENPSTSSTSTTFLVQPTSDTISLPPTNTSAPIEPSNKSPPEDSSRHQTNVNSIVEPGSLSVSSNSAPVPSTNQSVQAVTPFNLETIQLDSSATSPSNELERKLQRTERVRDLLVARVMDAEAEIYSLREDLDVERWKVRELETELKGGEVESDDESMDIDIVPRSSANNALPPSVETTSLEELDPLQILHNKNRSLQLLIQQKNAENHANISNFQELHCRIMRAYGAFQSRVQGERAILEAKIKELESQLQETNAKYVNVQAELVKSIAKQHEHQDNDKITRLEREKARLDQRIVATAEEYKRKQNIEQAKVNSWATQMRNDRASIVQRLQNAEESLRSTTTEKDRLYNELLRVQSDYSRLKSTLEQNLTQSYNALSTTTQTSFILEPSQQLQLPTSVMHVSQPYSQFQGHSQVLSTSIQPQARIVPAPIPLNTSNPPDLLTPQLGHNPIATSEEYKSTTNGIVEIEE